jgi:hypothetical protein
MEVAKTEVKDLLDLIKASRNLVGTVVAYRYGEIRIYKDIAYILSSLGRNNWYILYTKKVDLAPDIEAIEYTSSGEIKEISIEEMGKDPKSIYYTILRPLKDDVIDHVFNLL